MSEREITDVRADVAFAARNSVGEKINHYAITHTMPLRKVNTASGLTHHCKSNLPRGHVLIMT